MTIDVGTPTLQQLDNEQFRVTTSINDLPLWFESRTPLAVSADAIVGLMLVPALERREVIVSDEPLRLLWQENNIGHLIAQFSAWWGYERGQEYLRADDAMPTLREMPPYDDCVGGDG